MAKKVIQGNFSVTVHRDGAFKTVKAGEVFDFTKDEIADIEAAHGKEALRNPVNEAPAEDKPPKAGKAEKAATPAEGGEGAGEGSGSL